MGFPFTVNGNTWSLADFQDGKYHENLGPFLYDCLEDFYTRLSGTSTTSVSIGTGSKTFTSQGGKLWVPGFKLKAVRRNSNGRSDAAIGFMSGTVTSYNSGTGSVTISVNQSFGSGSHVSWDLVPSEISVVPSTPLSTGYGGSGVTSLSSARNYVKIPDKTNSMATVMEDFLGYLPATSSVTDSLSNRFKITCTGNAEVYTGGNVISKASLDGRHPGILVMSVGSSFSSAQVELSGAPIACFLGGSVMEIGFMLTEQSTLENLTKIEMGLKFTGGVPYYNGFSLNWPGVVSGFNGADMTLKTSASEDEYTSQFVLEPGIWYALRIASNGSDIFAEIYKLRNDGVVRDSVAYFEAALPGPSAENSYVPFISFSKESGGSRRTLLVDYVYFSKPNSRA